MTQDELEQAALNHAAGVLNAAIVRFCEGRLLDRGTLATIRQMVDLHTRECKEQGIKFPPMHVFAFARLGAIELVRKDLEAAGVEQIIVNWTARYPTITTQEIAEAVGVMFPNYRVTVMRERAHPGTATRQ